jgi:hypothetical protein
VFVRRIDLEFLVLAKGSLVYLCSLKDSHILSRVSS